MDERRTVTKHSPIADETTITHNWAYVQGATWMGKLSYLGSSLENFVVRNCFVVLEADTDEVKRMSIKSYASLVRMPSGGVLSMFENFGTIIAQLFQRRVSLHWNYQKTLCARIRLASRPSGHA